MSLVGLKSLKIVFSDAVYIADAEYPNLDRIFLSKLTGILAFKKLANVGARSRFIYTMGLSLVSIIPVCTVYLLCG